MSVNGLNTSMSALQANQFRIDTAANNIANVNTDGFQARTVQTADQAYINDIGQGTRVAATYTDARPGAPVYQPNAVYEPGTGAADTGGGAGVAGNAGAAEAATQSNTDLVREMTGMTEARTAYGANIAMARTVDSMNQTLLDIKA